MNVLWIGGAPNSGKTSVARLLADRHSLELYSFDRAESDHIARLDPLLQPALHDFLGMTMDERWVRRSAAEMAANTIASWTQRFDLVLEDLGRYGDRPVIAEGPGFFPDTIAPLLTSADQAIWLIPTPGFLEFAFGEGGLRQSAIPPQTSDPERALHNLIERNVLLAGHVRRRTEALGLAWLDVDGARSVEEIASEVEAHFAPRLGDVDGAPPPKSPPLAD